MATRHGRPRPTTRLRCDTLEPRETPAGTPAIDFGAGFSADRLPGGIPDGYATGELLLTDGRNILYDGRDQARAVFAPNPVDVRAFQTSFEFRVEGRAGPMGDGFTFALSGHDLASVGTAGGGTGEGLGYQGLLDSVAIKFDLVDNAGEGSNSVGVFTGGANPTTPAVGLDGTGIDLHSGRSYRADISYDGQTLTLTLTDVADPAHTWAHEFAVDVPAAIGSPTGYAGFTAGTGLLFARQAIEAWTFTEGTPEVPVDRPPEITFPPSASFLAPSSLILFANATDDGGADNLTYTWEVVSATTGAPLPVRPFDDPGGRQVIVESGDRLNVRVTVRDVKGQTATSEASFSGPTYVRGFELSPAGATVPAGGTIQFEALVRDWAGNPMPDYVGKSWQVVSGPGTIDRSGRYTAPADAGGPVTVRAEIPVFLERYGLNRATAEATVLVVPTPPPAGRLDFGSGFAGADLAGNGSARVTDGRLRLADGSHQAGSAFAPTPVDVRGFTTSFQFQIGDRLGYRYGDGLTFVLQNAGSTALGRAGSGLGYEGIGQSVAVKFDLVDNLGEGPQSVGVYTGGAAPTVPADRLPAPPPGQGNGGLLLNTAHVFRADLTYADGVLTLRLWDTVTGHGATWRYAVDIPAAVGGPTAYAGFTAGTGELFAPINVLHWTYAPTQSWVPGPLPTDDGAPSIAVDAVVSTGTISTVAGIGVPGYGGDGGPATAAHLASPYGVAVDAAGNLFIADRANSRVRRVDGVTGVITTVAGHGGFGYTGDNVPATQTALGSPAGVAVDSAGNLYIADFSNSRVRRVDAATGVITTVAGIGTAGFGGDNGPATSASLNFPDGVAVDAAGNLYIADTGNSRVRRVDMATGVITTVAGTGTAGFAGDGGPAADAQLFAPGGVAVDQAGNLYIADSHNQRVRRVDADTGVITTVAGTGTLGYAGDAGPARSAQLYSPRGVAVDAAGNLYIADVSNYRVRRVDADTGVITTVAGTGASGDAGDGGPATAAPLVSPRGVAVDGAGNLFIADTFHDRVRKVHTATRPEGQPVAYTFTITNTSAAATDPVTVTSVVDTVLGDLTAAARAANGGNDIVLAPGQRFTFSAPGPVLGPGTLVTTVTVTAHDDDGAIVTASDTVTLTVT